MDNLFNINKELINKKLQEGKFFVPQPPSIVGVYKLFTCLILIILIFSPFFYFQFSKNTFNTVVFILLMMTFILFLCDYLTYRIYTRKKHRQDLVNLCILLESEKLADFYLKGNVNKFSELLQSNEKKERPVNHNLLTYPMLKIQKSFIKKLISREQISNQKILDAGYGSGEIITLYKDNDNSVIGTELSSDNINKYQSLHDSPSVKCDVHYLPFKNNIFEVINFTDLLEHLENPQSALNEISRLLKPGGLLVMSTPNSQSITLDTVSNPLNPFIILEKIISLRCERILPPRRLMQLFEEDGGSEVYVYHTTFSKKELSFFLGNAGFKISNFSTYIFLNRGFARIFSVLPKFLRQRWVVFAVKMETLLSQIPVIKYLGANWLICARKIEMDRKQQREDSGQKFKGEN